MRKLILLGLFLSIVLPAFAVEQITVAELEHRIAVATAHRIGLPIPFQREEEDKLTADLGTLMLSERLSAGKAQEVAKKYSMGPAAKSVLQLMAARSDLLDLPQNEWPTLAPPDAEAQKRMIGEAGTFVFQTLKRLPNFFATRTTARAAGITADLNKNSMIKRLGLFPAGGSSHEITFRNGQEVIEPTKTEGSPQLPEMGLESWGEFGPEPAIVLLDAMKGTITFHHWEQTPGGLAAVFHYDVPQADSHYEVNYSCLGFNTFHNVPGYHGSLAIDPTTGAILRLTLETDWKAKDPITHVASVIEYGSVDIGGRSYVCPLKSIAVSVEEPGAECSHNGHSRYSQGDQPVLMLNQTSFSNYHRLGSTAKILLKGDELPQPAEDATPPAAPPPAPPAAPAKAPEK